VSAAESFLYVTAATVTRHAAAIAAAVQGALAIAASQVTSGTFDDARIAESNVTQHEAALELATSQVTSGTFDNARISQSSVTQHQAALSVATSQLTGTIGLAQLANQAEGYVETGEQSTTGVGYGTGYTNLASHTYTPRRSASRVLVVGYVFHVHASGTTTITLRRGTTVIAAENTFSATGGYVSAVVDTSHGGSATTWSISGKNSTPAGSGFYAQVFVVDIA